MNETIDELLRLFLRNILLIRSVTSIILAIICLNHHMLDYPRDIDAWSWYRVGSYLLLMYSFEAFCKWRKRRRY